MKGLIFGGAYLRREICVSKSIGLALLLEVNLSFWLCCTLYLRAIFQVQAPQEAYIWRGDLTVFFFFCVTGLGAYIWRGLFSEFYDILFSISRSFRPFYSEDFRWLPKILEDCRRFPNTSEEVRPLPKMSEVPSKHLVFSSQTVSIKRKMTNLTAKTKNYGQITLNTKPHSDPLKRGRFIVK